MKESSAGLSLSTILCFVLFFIFLTLKLCNVLNWEWLCVFIPLFVMVGIWFIKLIIILILVSME